MNFLMIHLIKILVFNFLFNFKRIFMYKTKSLLNSLFQFNLLFNTKQVYTCSYLCLLYTRKYITRPPSPPPNKISNFWLEFEKYEQYMCSKNQINKMTRLFKTLPQRKKTRSLSKAMSIPISPLVPLIWNSPLHFPSHSLIRI